MKKGLLHILFSLILTFAVTDYLWIELFVDEDKIVAELETEKEKEAEEELKEGTHLKTKHDPVLFGWSEISYPPSEQLLFFTGYLRHGNSFCPSLKSAAPKLYLLQRRLKLHC